MGECEIAGNIPANAFEILLKHGEQVLLEVSHEQLTALAGENAQNISLVILEVIEEMGDLFLQPVIGGREIMRGLRMELV